MVTLPLALILVAVGGTRKPAAFLENVALVLLFGTIAIYAVVSITRTYRLPKGLDAFRS